MIRGVRGATTVARNEAGEITERTRELLQLLVDALMLALHVFLVSIRFRGDQLLMPLAAGLTAACSPAPITPPPQISTGTSIAFMPDEA